MVKLTNTHILVIIALVVVLYLVFSRKEQFSASGLAISDKYCTQMADVYYRPKVYNPTCRDNYRKKICGPQRRKMINYNTGNYFTLNGELV